MAEVNTATEEAFERYYAGGFRSGNPYWLYLGFGCMVAIGLLAGAVMDWRIGGDMSRAVPGVFVPNQTQYLFVGGVAVEVKLIEYALMFVAGIVLMVCYLMAGK